MQISRKDVLLVGSALREPGQLTDYLHDCGYHSRSANTLRIARRSIASASVDLVLSSIHLPDGTGSGLMASLSGLPVSGFLCFLVRGGCFWLPALDRGVLCSDRQALRPAEFAALLKQLAPRTLTSSLQPPDLLATGESSD